MLIGMNTHTCGCLCVCERVSMCPHAGPAKQWQQCAVLEERWVRPDGQRCQTCAIAQHRHFRSAFSDDSQKAFADPTF